MIIQGTGSNKLEVEEEDHHDAVADEEQGMQCSDHPYRGNNQGGICGFCLQEKLGKLLSSSSSNFNSSSFLPADSSPAVATSSSSTPYAFRSPTHHHARARIPFGFSQKKNKKEDNHRHDHQQQFQQHRHHCAPIKLQRSRSTATPIRGRCSRKRPGSGIGITAGGFLTRSLFYLNLKPFSSRSSTRRRMDKNPINSVDTVQRSKANIILELTDEIESPNGNAVASSSSSFGRKVSRSRSVGCGSRSFSGDFFERISTGFGDCTLRRAESQREGNPQVPPVKERVKCGGIFSGFNLITPSSSSSYWLSASEEDHSNSKPTMTPSWIGQGKMRSWGWALASPMRVFSKPPPSSSSKESNESSTNNTIAPSSTATVTKR